MEQQKYITITNNRRCPICGSDMKRNASDNPHDMYTEHRTCCNPNCGIEATFHN